jgi:ERCC4-type nuclease
MNNIVVDFRERHTNSSSACLASALDRYGITYTLQALPCADILITNPTTGGVLAIERKTISDLINSTLDNRLFSEIEKMNNTYEKNILIIEGLWSDYEKERKRLKRAKYIKNAIFFSIAHKAGLFSSITLRTSTRIIQTDSMEQTIAVVNSLCAKFQDGKIWAIPTVTRTKTPEKIYINMLQAYPGISEAKAEAIIKKYPSWADFSHHVLNKTFQCPGFGPKTVEMFSKALS